MVKVTVPESQPFPSISFDAWTFIFTGIAEPLSNGSVA
jgi:hypothetical protein